MCSTFSWCLTNFQKPRDSGFFFFFDLSSSFLDSPLWFSISSTIRPDGKQIAEMRNSKNGQTNSDKEEMDIMSLNTINTVQIEN